MGGREREHQGEEKGRRGRRGVQGSLQEVVSTQNGKQDVALAVTWELHAAALCVSAKKTTTTLHIAP
jgi:hypothetical protein